MRLSSILRLNSCFILINNFEIVPSILMLVIQLTILIPKCGYYLYYHNDHQHSNDDNDRHTTCLSCLNVSLFDVEASFSLLDPLNQHFHLSTPFIKLLPHETKVFIGVSLFCGQYFLNLYLRISKKQFICFVCKYTETAEMSKYKSKHYNKNTKNIID